MTKNGYTSLALRVLDNSGHSQTWEVHNCKDEFDREIGVDVMEAGWGRIVYSLFVVKDELWFDSREIGDGERGAWSCLRECSEMVYSLVSFVKDEEER